MIRHRYASRLYAKTGDVLLVRQALGHKSIGSTLVYVDSDRSRLRAAVE
jgi:site-specific recombinase XerD